MRRRWARAAAAALRLAATMALLSCAGAGTSPSAGPGDVPGGDGAPAAGDPARLRIRGSDTMLRLVQRWAEAFMAAHPGIVVEVEGGGTAVGIRSLIRGRADIATASRPLTSDEARQLVEGRGSLGYAILTARDALSVYLHPDNPVTDLTLDQLRGIFSGELRRWSEVGGSDAEIVVLNRNPASGTQLFFAEHVLRGASYRRDARVLPTTAAIVAAVAADPHAIGYGGIGYAEGVRLCTIDGVAPSTLNVRRGTYPIARYLYFYTAEAPDGLLQELVDWVLGSEAQALVTEAGYVALYEP